jgi:Uma2 family endonuclease
MNIVTPTSMDADTFLRWNEGREGKRELVNGRIVEMMVHVTRAHARVVGLLTAALLALVDRSKFDVFASDFGLKTPKGVRYPDVVVDVVGGDGRDLAVTAPVLVCEVLSKSTIATDMIEKAAEYTAVESVQSYLVLSQDEPRAWLWSRTSGGWAGPVEFEGGATIDLSSLAIEVPLRDLYPVSSLQ